MNSSKKINVNFSSLVGLKAELLRKQTEIKDSKAKEETQPRVPKPKIKRKKIKEKTPKIEPGYTEIEDIGTLRKSKLMLEAKSMLYDKLKKNGGDDGRNYLVDFAHKSDSSEDEFHREEDYDDVNSDPEDDWVEYKDCFGRTRKCLRRDLAKMREKDNIVKREIMEESNVESDKNREKSPEPATSMPEKAPEIEKMRKKWEEQMEKLADKTDIHYQDVLFDEARTHGVGYYSFSQNEEERAKQQENLAKLRKETEQRQKEMQEVRDIKSKMELNRLRAATIRQRVRAGLPAELTEDEETALKAQIKMRHSIDTQDNEKDTNPEAIEVASKAPKSHVDNSLIIVEDKIKAFGELLGKRPKWHEMSQEEWVYKRRRDRLDEFAPVYENFRRSGSLKASRDDRVTTRDDYSEDPVRINARGPEPTDRWETSAPIYQRNDIKEEKIEEKMKDNEDPISKIKESYTIEDSEDSDEEEIGPLPPTTLANPIPPTFINSFVPQPMMNTPSLPVEFIRSIPPPPINFNVPPPSMVPSLSIPPPFASETNVIAESREQEEDDSSDSDDSIIIGPVPPPSLTDFTNVTTLNCGPSLINTGLLDNMLSEIPLPTPVQFPVSQNCSNNELPKILEDQPKNGRKTSDNLEAIAAGLKYLRQKFESTH